MKNIIGPPVTGDELKFRDKEVSDILTMLGEGNSIELDDLLIDLVSDEFLTLDSRVAEYGFTANLVAKWWQITRGN
jgi:hypothetical protein